mmetsp:Transcript_5175/g.16596  ORF Transcript_5175/g.16596 Transcript_5175/m.16596 type:complete len:227 (-) Transcript_5175:498-1178(-)
MTFRARPFPDRSGSLSFPILICAPLPSLSSPPPSRIARTGLVDGRERVLLRDWFPRGAGGGAARCRSLVQKQQCLGQVAWTSAAYWPHFCSPLLHRPARPRRHPRRSSPSPRRPTLPMSSGPLWTAWSAVWSGRGKRSRRWSSSWRVRVSRAHATYDASPRRRSRDRSVGRRSARSGCSRCRRLRRRRSWRWRRRACSSSKSRFCSGCEGSTAGSSHATLGAGFSP